MKFGFWNGAAFAFIFYMVKFKCVFLEKCCLKGIGGGYTAVLLLGKTKTKTQRN